MEIIRFLLNYFLKSYSGDYAPILKILGENGFNLGKTLNSLTPDSLENIVDALMKNYKNKSPMTHQTFKLSPISSFADKEIVNSLNRYFSE